MHRPKESQAQQNLEAEQAKQLAQEQAQQESERKRLEAERIAALRGQFGAPGFTGSASDSSSLYGQLTGRQGGAQGRF